MELNQIKELVNIMESSMLESLEVETNDIKIKMGKSNTIKSNIKPKEKNLNQGLVSEEYKIQNQKEEKIEYTKPDEVNHENLTEIKSPMVGTFYESSSPESASYVKVGDKVKKGDILCIVEAMKVMNEIEAEIEGEVVEILVSNESPVEYGQVLFKIKGA
ncbi:acetyl-CoA carboxylase biotin carboxyl carrier protein [Acetoanaerobium pronyense]|uniref:Biotin carboxyl carrier protein of acetyl-CoA carboxylase n=1 Tax=Acetoanaerobium pronyense TaxID=1482736 RepID=A0ABS4KR10_9FIRM|nr:acetyl-CoA carboxylase biotin carboxyl carrier protein [Acetoanaerobium pronyense]MBP2029044.1 acetyl-CoA carboxylase biotin carboxyl carrier protein [Acetoanaerobium pronyense]